MSTPSLAGSEAPASIALLEKIIREMGTKEGQESLIRRLVEVSEKLSGMATSAKLNEVIDHVRAQSEQAIIMGNSSPGIDMDKSRSFSFEKELNQLDVRPDLPRSAVSHRIEHLMKSESRRNSEPSARGANILNDDLINIIRSVKDSVAQGGGLTAEVKALVRELRGEVLGMGREIGRRLEGVSRKGVEDHDSPSKDEVARVIDEGLEQMKDQLNHVLREHRRQSAASVSTQKTAVDYQEIYNAMRTAIRDNEETRGDMPDLNREDVIEAVRDAWENYKPEIEVQQLGLERDEVLACLKEGLQEYAPRDDRPPAATRDEVFTAVVEGLKHFVPPQVDSPATLSREEIIDAVRDCLEEFEFPVAPSALGNNEITREDMIHAVKEGLNDLDLHSSRALVPSSANTDDITERLKEVMDYLRHEFKAVSEEAKQNVAANGRDTEQVLDATKDGFENLRKAMEGYVDQATGATGQEEFMDDLLKSLDDFKDEIAGLISNLNEQSHDQLQTELEGLREVVNSSMVPAMPQQSNSQEVLEALNTGFNNMRQEILRPRAETSEILDALNDGLNDLRAGMDRVTNKPADLTANDEILDALRSGLESVRVDIESIRDSSNDRAVVALDATPPAGDDVLEALKTGLSAVRSDIEALRDSHAEKAVATVDHSSNNEILDALKDGLDSLRADIEDIREATGEKAAAPVDSTTNDEVIDALKNGLNSLRVDIEAMRENSDKALVPLEHTSNEDMVEALRNGLDSIRLDIETLHSEKSASNIDNTSNDEVIEALKNGLESIRVDIEALQTNNDKAVAPIADANTNTNDEILEALKSGLESVRFDIESLRETNGERAVSPEDNASDEKILDALKSGLDSVRSDIKSLRDSNSERALAAISTESNDESATPADGAKQDDIKNLEVLVAQLSIKLEALEPSKTGAQKDDVTRMEEMLRNLQDSVDEIASREPTTSRAVSTESKDASGDDSGAASKDDVVAIETILRNTKARLDDFVDGEQSVRKDHIDTLEALLLETRESMSAVTLQLDTVSRKEEMQTLETLLGQVTAGLDEIKERVNSEADNPDKVSKADVEAVEALALEIKNTIEGFTTTDLALLARKDDVTSLEAVVKEFQEKLDSTVDASTKAVAVRDEEMTGVGERVTEVRTFLEEFQGTIKTKLEEGATGVEGISKLLETMGEKMDKNETVGQDLKDMFETMKTEFEDSKEVVSGVKVESNEKLQEATETLGTKIDEKIGELIAKYDALQTMLDGRSTVSEARDEAMEAAVVGSKTIADELKLLVDTLGSTVTDSLEKMEEASKTVFTRVEELVTKNEENHTEGKTEHQQTRDQIAQALTVVEGLKDEVNDANPKVLEAVKDLLLLVGEHFEHSKSSVAEIQEKIVENKAPDELKTLLPPEKYDNTEVHEKLDKLAESKYDDAEIRQRLDKMIEEKYNDAEVREKLDAIIEAKYDDTEVREKLTAVLESKYDDAEVREKLEKIIEQRYDDTEVREKLEKIIEDKYNDSDVKEMLGMLVDQRYDDSEVREKLDKLVDHSTVAEQAFSRFDTLDQVHASVVRTAADISEFLTAQKQRIEEAHDDHERTLQETLLSVERKLAEKDHVEASVMSLRNEEERLRQSIIGLRTEQESLIRQKTRLTGDVSSLETALRLRKDELYDMESRAEGLERRILEGVMDHSRVLLMSKAGKNGGDAMSRKRVKKPTNETEAPPQAARKPIVSMALTAKRNLAPPAQGGNARRIVSLSQINNNVASGGMKRSQSVRTPAATAKGYRKRSWGGHPDKSLGHDKENAMGVNETVEEVDELETRPVVPETSDLPGDETTVLDSALNDDGGDSDNETLRRSSRGTVITNSTDMYTDGDSYSEYSDTASEWTESAVGTDVGVQGNEMVVYGP